MHIKRTSAHDMRPGARPRFSRPSGRGGFTIVEMLVVLGIIVMLISILIVALSKAAAVGQQANTSFLMSSMSSGIAQFKGDHGYVPPVLGVNGTPDSYPGWSRDGILPGGWEGDLSQTDLNEMQQWYSVTSLAEYLLGYGSRDEDGYGVIGDITAANNPGRLESPAVGIRSPGGDGLWGAVFNPRVGGIGQPGGYLYRNPGGAGTGIPVPGGATNNNGVQIKGRIFGPYIELKDANLLGGLAPNGDVVGPEDPDYANRPKVILDYWGTPIRYYRRAYDGGDPAVYRKGVDLGDIFALRPWTIKADLESNGAPDGRGDTSTTPQLKAAEFGLLSVGPDRSVAPISRYDTEEFNRDNIQELGP